MLIGLGLVGDEHRGPLAALLPSRVKDNKVKSMK